jgi:glycine/D-amino acid oxidase-like deaminating enzyme
VSSAAAAGVAHERLPVAHIARRAPWAAGVRGEAALWIPGDGVIDVHAALSGFLGAARGRGVEVWTGCEARDPRVDAHAVSVTAAGTTLEAEALVVAAGAWAGELAADAGSRVELAPLRRHLFISAPDATVAAGTPWIWVEDVFYARPESGGLLLSGCDESPHPAAPPAVAPGVAEALAETLARHAAPLAELRLRRGWACLRTFGPARAPLIGWDERVPRLFLVAGLGGHGATGSAAVGRRAAEAIVARIGT